MLTTHRHGYTVKVERAIMPHPHGTWLATVFTNDARYIGARSHRPTVSLALMNAFYNVDKLVVLENLT